MSENLRNVEKDYFQDKTYDIGFRFAGITAASKLDKKLSVLLLKARDLEYIQNEI